MDLQIGNFLVAIVSMLAASGATIITLVLAGRASRIAREEAIKENAEERKETAVKLATLRAELDALDRAHNISQAENARDWNEFTTAQGTQFEILRDIQSKMSEYAESLAAQTATLMAMKERLDREHERRMQRE